MTSHALARTRFDVRAVFNHVSAQASGFQRFLADDARYRDFFIPVAGSQTFPRSAARARCRC
jgi:hypothetical protein